MTIMHYAQGVTMTTVARTNHTDSTSDILDSIMARMPLPGTGPTVGTLDPRQTLVELLARQEEAPSEGNFWAEAVEEWEDNAPTQPVGPEPMPSCRLVQGSTLDQAAGELVSWLASMDHDRARTKNGQGFNKMDSNRGHRMANAVRKGYRLYPNEIDFAKKCAKRYWAQLQRAGEEIQEAARLLVACSQ
jgi:hypothetical protein